MTDTLLCCPFCGGGATVQPWRDPPEVGGTIARIRCTRCAAQSAPYADASYAAEAWNDRECAPSEARLREMLYRVVDRIRYAANSEGGLAAEIDLFLGDGIAPARAEAVSAAPPTKPRYRVRLVKLPAGWTFDFSDTDASVGGMLVCVYTTRRAAQYAARRLLAAIRAGDVDESEIV